jgi:hypothetical protein
MIINLYWLQMIPLKIINFKNMETIRITELKGINGGYYYTRQEVNSMKPRSCKTAENIGFSVGRAIAFIGVYLITKRF